MNKSSKQWNETFDIVMVGSGAGAMCSALLAQSHGKRALVLEKEARFGGSSARSGGAVWIPFNHLILEKGIQDDYDKARKYVEACIKEWTIATTPERIEAYLKTGPELVRFLESQGIMLRHCAGYCDYFDELPGGIAEGRAFEAELFDSRELGDWASKMNRYEAYAMPCRVSEFPLLSNATRTWRGRLAALRLGIRMMLEKRRGARIFGQGAALQGRILKEALARGIDIRLETPVVEIISENGVVVGVAAQHGGHTIRIRATSGVLINSGGFSANLELRKKYLPNPQTTTGYYMGNPGDTGEVMQMIMGIGAAVDQLEEAWWNPGGQLPSGIAVSHTYDLTKPHVMMVDSTAQRYANEATSYMELGQIMYARHKHVPAIPSWAILDSRHRNRYTWGMAMPRHTPKEWLDVGYMKKADNIEGLAAECGLDPIALRRTIDRFNGFARNGKDEDFGRGNRAFDRLGGDPTNKPNPSLGTIEEPPFYAAPINLADVGTCGGLVTDPDGRVLRQDGTAIPGLYAFGNVAANCFGRSYPGPGITLGQSFIFGYRATRHALRVNQ
jgi:3-oxosteroid 1-dehydrogenase